MNVTTNKSNTFFTSFGKRYCTKAQAYVSTVVLPLAYIFLHTMLIFSFCQKMTFSKMSYFGDMCLLMSEVVTMFLV